MAKNGIKNFFLKIFFILFLLLGNNNFLLAQEYNINFGNRDNIASFTRQDFVTPVSPAIVTIFSLAPENFNSSIYYKQILKDIQNEHFLKMHLDKKLDNDIYVDVETNVSYKKNFLGSGIIVDKEGLILSTMSVIQNFDDLKTKILGKTYDLEVVSKDMHTNLVLLKVKDNAFFPNLKVADREFELSVNDEYYLLSNPFDLGVYATPVRLIFQTAETELGTWSDFMQFNASNSILNNGGAVINDVGELIAIADSRLSGFGTFATPNLVIEIFKDQVQKNKRLTRFDLGVFCQKY